MLKQFGSIGVIVGGLACLSPLLLGMFGIAGVAWLPAYMDIILIPLLVIGLGVIIYNRRRDEKSGPANQSTGKTEQQNYV